MWSEAMIKNAMAVVESGQPLRPVFLMKTTTAIYIVDMHPFMDDKDLMSDMLKLIILKEQPDEYLLMMESFIKQLDVKDPAELAISALLMNGTVSVSQLPSAQECITVLHGTKETERLGQIIFKKESRRIVFQPIEWSEGGNLRGRFAGLRVTTR